MSVDWSAVAERVREIAEAPGPFLNEGQRDSLWLLAARIPQHGMIVADEVGMGKTRIAVALARAVTDAGGRVAILLPTTLGFQWQDELRQGGVADPGDVVRSLWQFLEAWSDPSCIRPWFSQSVVLLSHGFANWRLHADGPAWRTQLLPALAGLARRAASGRAPNGFSKFEKELSYWVSAAAQSIITWSATASIEMKQSLQDLEKETPWEQARNGQDFQRNGSNRRRLHRAVGLGFGAFDLVIVDEAHKSRHSDSGLSRLLDEVLLSSQGTRHLCLTATPVELDVGQWMQALARVGVSRETRVQISSAVNSYAAGVRRLRTSWKSSPEARAEFTHVAEDFQEALSPYVTRRDKRRDEDVIRYRQNAFQQPSISVDNSPAENVDSYRWQHPIPVSFSRLEIPWKSAVCAAEALSIVTHMDEDPRSKRLRLTFGSGHGIASGLDHEGGEDDDPTLALDSGLDQPPSFDHTADPTLPADVDIVQAKRSQRIAWWKTVLGRVSGRSGALYDHPAILAAVAAIDDYTARGEKVLVFGRFTEPMRALVALLNARQMLRTLDEGKSWPQSRIAREEVRAIEAAHRQLGRPGTFNPDQVNAVLARQYEALDRRRGRLRQRVFDLIDEGLQPAEQDARALAAAARAAGRPAHLAAAIEQILGDRAPGVILPLDDRNPNLPGEYPPEAVAECFVALMAALRDREEDRLDGGEGIREYEAVALWTEIERRLEGEYSVERGRFARLMSGATDMPTRRALQLAFNRHESNPRVLVAQSLVGREGLNLHRACRVVVLLHPEWNPSVVEQQIGRVDRVGSHWAASVERAIDAQEQPLPRIEIRPVIFEGTYDTHHWAVLLGRWDDMRAQLHGIIIPEHERTGCTEQELDLLWFLDKEAPDFSPPPRR